ncbi:DUF636 domain protein [Thozetella sp. PMI_491]|nr:DUF636 domain protein [Thozetella sp. PMI_491]
MASDEEVKILTARCYCKAVHFTVSVPVSKLPLPTHLCHCPICRYTHGTLCIFHAPLPVGIEPEFVAPSSLDVVTGYTHKEDPAAERYFCSTCGCHIGDIDLEADPATGKKEWRVATSIFDDHSDSSFLIRSHVYTEAAAGGGLANWLHKVGEREMRTWNPEPENPDLPIPSRAAPKQEFDEQGREVLRAECHCGGVSFTVPRPDRPETTGSDFIKTFVSPLEPNKWLACVDVCDDCRLVDGAHAIAWTFIPLAQTQPRIPPDLKFGTLVPYRSSPAALRAFCGVCGATVFYTHDDRTPSEEEAVADIAVGILRAPEGPLAEKWLTWRTGRLAWHGSGSRYDRTFTEGLATGMDEWGKKTYGESPSFPIG